MKLFWTQIFGLPILALDEERPVGFLTGVFIDPETGKILAFRSGLSHFLAPIDLRKWSTKQIEISEASALSSLDELLRLKECGLKKTSLLSKRVLDQQGKSLGRVHDFSIDTTLNVLHNIESSKRVILWDWDRRIFDWKHIQSINEKTIIVNTDARQKRKSPTEAGLSKWPIQSPAL